MTVCSEVINGKDLTFRQRMWESMLLLSFIFNWISIFCLPSRKCSHQLAIDWSALYDCSAGPYSTILQLEMSNKTNSLEPPQNWIPWITIDGKHSDDIQTLAEKDLQKLICDYYREEKPIECRLKALREAKYESFPFNRYLNKNGIIEP